MPHSGGFGVRSLRVTKPTTRRTLIATCLSGATDHRVRAARHGTYGARRVHTEPTLGHGIAVGLGRMKLLMRAAGLNELWGPTHVPNIRLRAQAVSWTVCQPDAVARRFSQRDVKSAAR